MSWSPKTGKVSVVTVAEQAAGTDALFRLSQSRANLSHGAESAHLSGGR